MKYTIDVNNMPCITVPTPDTMVVALQKVPIGKIGSFRCLEYLIQRISPTVPNIRGNRDSREVHVDDVPAQLNDKDTGVTEAAKSAQPP